MGYYVAQKESALPVAQMGLSQLTEVIHFSALPNADGTLDTGTNGLTEIQANAVSTATHLARKRVLLCIGGEGSQSRFIPAIAATTRSAFVASIVSWVASHGYDGVDLDMEPIDASSLPDYTAFARALRAALDARLRGAMLTAAVRAQPQAFAGMSDVFDRVSVMTYGMSGPYRGWETWYNSPLSAGGQSFAGSSGRSLPAIDDEISTWLGAGVAPGKLGVGVPFFGKVWTGATGPHQSVQGVKMSNIAYADLLTIYGGRPSFPQLYHWDAVASVPWLGVSGASTASSEFVSYDDEQSVAAKIAWAKGRGLAGAIVWDLSGDWHNQGHPLLQALAGAVAK